MTEKLESAEATVQAFCRETGKRYSAEENFRIALEERGGDASIAALYRREGVPTNLYSRTAKIAAPLDGGTSLSKLACSAWRSVSPARRCR